MLCHRVTFITNAGVWNLLYNGLRNLAAHGVGLLAVTNFLLHPGTGDLSGFGPRNPTSAGHRTASLFAGGMATTLFVFARVAQRIPSPCTWITNALFDDRTRNLFGFCHPITGADCDFFCFAHGLANRVADIAVTGLGLGTIGRAANVTIFRFADGLANRATNVAIAGLEAWFADCTANVAIACLITWLSDRATYVFVACLKTWLPDGTGDVAVARLIAWLADRVALIPITGFVNVSRAGNRILFCNLIVDRPAAIHHLLFVNSFTNLFIAGAAATFCSAVIPAGRTRL